MVALTNTESHRSFSKLDASKDVQLFEQAGRNSSILPVSYWINPEIKENWDTQFGDRENQVVFIGKGYNKDDIIVELEKCLDERAYA